MAENLKQKAATGIIWTTIQKFSSIGISFISGIILARLLTPYDYGCIGMLAVFMALASTLIDGGFGSALIQKKQPTQDDYSTIFFWNMGMTTLMYVVLFFCAPAIARFYDIPLLSKVLRVQGLVLFINAFNIIQNNILKKRINFKAISIVTIITSVTSLAITIWMAYKGFGVWALVAQNLITAAIPAIVFWFYVKWKPSWSFSWQSFKSLFSFGFFMFMSNLINTFCAKLSSLLIGRLYSPVTLGYYSKAVGTEELASNTISSVMTQVTYPLYAQVQDDKALLGNMVRRLTMTISLITFPMMAMLMLAAKPIFVLLYSDRWVACVPYFQVLCLVGLATCLQAVNTQTIAAIGKSKLMFYWTIIKRAVGMTFIIGGLFWFGMKGLLAGVVIYNWFCYFVNIGLVSKHIGYRWNKQLYDLLPITAVTVLGAGAAFLIGHFCDFNMYLDGLLKLTVFSFLFIGWIVLFNPESYQYFLTVIPEKFQFWKKKITHKNSI